MKINFKAVLKDINGEEMKQDAAPDSPVAMLGSVAKQALLTQKPGEEIPEDKKYHYYKIVKRIEKSLDADSDGIVDLPVEDVALIKKRIGRLFAVGVVGPCFELLEQES